MAASAASPPIPAARDATLDYGTEIGRAEGAGPQDGDPSVAVLAAYLHHLLVREAEAGPVKVSLGTESIQKDARTGHAWRCGKKQDLMKATAVLTRSDECRRRRIEFDEHGVRVRTGHDRYRQHVGGELGDGAGGRRQGDLDRLTSNHQKNVYWRGLDISRRVNCLDAHLGRDSLRCIDKGS